MYISVHQVTVVIVIVRNVYWTEMSGRIEVTSVKFVCVKTTLVSRDSTTFVPTSIVINPNTR